MEAKGLEPSNLLTASQALYQLSYAPEDASTLSDLADDGLPNVAACTEARWRHRRPALTT